MEVFSECILNGKLDIERGEYGDGRRELICISFMVKVVGEFEIISR